MRLTVLLISVAFLAGCGSSYGDRDFMPNGYAYHHNTYKSEPGSEMSHVKKTALGDVKIINADDLGGDLGGDRDGAHD